MKIVELRSIEELLTSFDLMKEMYPSITLSEYRDELNQMINNNYSQLAVFDNEKIVGICGIWINTKLWSRKYMELDNIIVSSKSRSKGIGKMMFDYAKNIATTENCNLIVLDSYTDNFEAHRFFFNQGFVPRGFHFISILNESKMRS